MADDHAYVSFAWKAEKQTPIVDRLDAACRARGIELHRDSNHIGYGKSIRAFMDEIGAARHVVVVLSDAYLKSEYCMYELREIERNRHFRARVLPIFVTGTQVFKATDRIAYLKHWEEERNKLNMGLLLIERTYTKNLNQSLDDYADYRRLMDEFLATLADMNALKEEVHLDTNFAALLDRIRPASPPGHDARAARYREPDERYASYMVTQVRAVLQECKPLALALDRATAKARPAADDLAQFLCAAKAEDSIDEYLRGATLECLRALQNKPEFSAVWEAAKTILVWLGPMSVSPEMVTEIERQERAGGAPTFELAVNTRFGVEIASARYRQLKPGFSVEKGKAEATGADALEEPILESGWSEDFAVEMLLLALWKQIFPEDTRQRLSDTDVENLTKTFQRREKNKAHHHYVAVPIDEKSASARRDFYKKVTAKLPSLTVIYFNPANAKPELRIADEVGIMTAVREFLSIPEQLSKRP
jgi:hypothetical protein